MGRFERRALVLAAGVAVMATAACLHHDQAAAPASATAPAAPAPAGTAPASAGLAGTSWRLVEFRSSDDSIGTRRPADPSKYTLTLGSDGRAAMMLDCNRATGAWKADPASGSSGSFGLGPLAMTRAMCPPGSMDTRIARDAEYVRSFVLKDGRLYLNLMADGGIYVWDPAPRP